MKKIAMRSMLFMMLAGSGLVVGAWEIKDPSVHDPVMAKGEDGRYYCFFTGKNIFVLSSADRVTWRPEHTVFDGAPAWTTNAVPGYRGIAWAPDISFHNGWWHLYYSCSTFGKNTSAIGLAVNKTLDPHSPYFKWVDRGSVVASHSRRTNWNAIDPNLIVDDSGCPYLVFGSFWDGIQLVELSKDDFRTPKTQPTTIARRSERGMNAVEAPFIFHHQDYYYLFVSFDFCCRGKDSNYKTVYGRASKITGPYVDKSGKEMASGGGTLLYGPDEKHYGIGHPSAYEFDGKCWFVAHAYRKDRNGMAKLFMHPLAFDADGWIAVPSN